MLLDAKHIDWGQLAREYVSGPDERSDDRCYGAWVELAGLVNAWGATIRQNLQVVEVDETEPYSTYEAMAADVRGNGRLLVSTRFCDHPIWDVPTNVNFRIWHDVMGHTLFDRGFDRQGELDVLCLGAPAVHGLSERACGALFAELTYQLSYAIDRGDFLSPQRVVLPHGYGQYVLRQALS